MNKTVKNILLYFAITGAVIFAILGIYSIWGDIDGDVISRTILTYIVLFLSILWISSTHELYDKFKYYPELASVGNWLLIISISLISLLICVLIWDAYKQSDLLWKIIATIWVINFSVVIFVFSMNKRWARAEDIVGLEKPEEK